MICTAIRFVCFVAALSLVLALVLPGAILAGLFYFLGLIFDDRGPSYFHHTR